MAVVKDHLPRHPKWAGLSDRAWRIGLTSIFHSNEFLLGGNLSKVDQNTIGTTLKIRRELIAAGVWEEGKNGAVLIHDWHDHNDDDAIKARRQANRERQKRHRERYRNGKRDALQSVTVTGLRKEKDKKSNSKSGENQPELVSDDVAKILNDAGAER